MVFDVTSKTTGCWSVEGVQRRATKLVPGLKELDHSERLKSMDLPSMKYHTCRESGDMTETYNL